tara:strand:- start:2292 stop:3077 length:786 start_codon:yes stop_codon:yes gene_type:complete
MPEWITLSPRRHSDQRYLPREGYHFAAEQPMADIVLAELGKLLPHYVLAFLQQDEHFQPVALLSLDGQTNLYVAPNGQWLGSYVPASLRGYPFTLANTDDGQKILCIEQRHLANDQGEPLFDDDGNPGQKVAQTLSFLQQCDRNRQVTLAATQSLSKAGVIEPWSLQLKQGEGRTPLTLNGLYRVSEKALNSLDGETYAQLIGTPMALAHAQLFSTHNLHQLTQRGELLAKLNAQDTVPENLDSVLDGMEDDDDLTFDFDN